MGSPCAIITFRGELFSGQAGLKREKFHYRISTCSLWPGSDEYRGVGRFAGPSTGFLPPRTPRAPRVLVGGRGFEVSGNGAMMGLVQDFFTTEAPRAQRFLWWEGADSRSVGMALCRGWYRFCFTTEAQRAQRFFVVGRRRLERSEPGGDCALSGVVGGFFTTEAQRAQRFFMVGWRGFEVSGNGAMLGLVGVFFHHRDTEGTEIFYGGVARIRGQWEWRDVGVGRGLFSPQRHRGHRDFMVGKRRLERGESGGNGALLGLVGGFFTTEAQRAQRFFMVGKRRFERSEPGGDCALS